MLRELCAPFSLDACISSVFACVYMSQQCHPVDICVKNMPLCGFRVILSVFCFVLFFLKTSVVQRSLYLSPGAKPLCPRMEKKQMNSLLGDLEFLIPYFVMQKRENMNCGA